MTLVTVPLSFLVLWTASGTSWETLWDYMLQAGSAVATEIGWVVGVYVPTLLGFYVLITGEQLGRATNAGGLRRLLGGVAELSFAALIPALLLLTLHSFSDPRNLGLLFVIVPAVGLLFFLTVQLGGFVVFDTAVLLDDAVDTQTRALARMRALRPRSQRPVLLVVVVNLLLALGVGALTLGLAADWSWLFEWPAVAFLLVTALIVTLLGAFVARLSATRTVLSSILAAVATILAWVLLAASVWTIGSPLVGAVAAAMLGYASLSAWFPMRRAPRLVADWSLAGGSALASARNALSTYRRATRRAAELSRELRDLSRPQRRSRLAAAWTAFRAAG